MKRAFLFLVAVAIPAGGISVPAAPEEQPVSVMTRNLYIGGDLSPLVVAGSPAQFLAAAQTLLAQMTATNFPERAEALAREIVERKPHLVALQEVYRVTLNGATGAPPFRDLLDDLLTALAAQGADYHAVAQVRNLDAAIPVPGLGIVQATDRDVILARSDVHTSVLHIPGCRSSLDGCNYQVFVALASPLGQINIERGFAVVDAHLPTGAIRFVNTHLEIPELPLIVQAAQATELVATLGALSNDASLPVIIAGDINSAPTDEPVVMNGRTIVPPYQQFAAAGFADAWDLRPGQSAGLTCCQAADLLNSESALFKRVDVVLTNVVPGRVQAQVVGRNAEDRTPSGLWPSDHAGVVARLFF